jgi:hypothetical protein
MGNPHTEILDITIFLYSLDMHQQISGAVLSEISIKEFLLDAWQKRISEKREGIHVSDLVGSCLRQKCFSKISDSPQPIDERTIKAFHVGIETHRLIQELLGSEEWDVEKEFIFKDGGINIIAHPDLIHKKTGVIGEIKTSTKMIKQPYPILYFTIVKYKSIKELHHYLVSIRS